MPPESNTKIPSISQACHLEVWKRYSIYGRNCQTLRVVPAVGSTCDIAVNTNLGPAEPTRSVFSTMPRHCNNLNTCPFRTFRGLCGKKCFGLLGETCIVHVDYWYCPPIRTLSVEVRPRPGKCLDAFIASTPIRHMSRLMLANLRDIRHVGRRKFSARPSELHSTCV